LNAAGVLLCFCPPQEMMAALEVLDSAANGDGVSVLCHVIADADAVNKRDYQ
jgi:hypothetical protein